MTEPKSTQWTAIIDEAIDLLECSGWKDYAKAVRDQSQLVVQQDAEVQRLRQHVAILQHEEAFTKAYCGSDSDSVVMGLRAEVQRLRDELALVDKTLGPWIKPPDDRIGAIKDVMQAHLSERGNAEVAQARLTTLDRLREELHAVDAVLDRRDALADLSNRVDKILRCIKLAQVVDPKAEIIKLEARLAIYEPEERDETLVCRACGNDRDIHHLLILPWPCSRAEGQPIARWRYLAAQKIMGTK